MEERSSTTITTQENLSKENRDNLLIKISIPTKKNVVIRVRLSRLSSILSSGARVRWPTTNSTTSTTI